MTKWKLLIDFLNSRLGKEVTRKELREVSGCTGWSLDGYRVTLEWCGFVDHVGKGRYKAIKEIPNVRSNTLRKLMCGRSTAGEDKNEARKKIQELLPEEINKKITRTPNVWNHTINFLNSKLNQIVTKKEILEVMNCSPQTSERYLRMLRYNEFLEVPKHLGIIRYDDPTISFQVVKQIPKYVSFSEMQEFFKGEDFQKPLTWFKFWGGLEYYSKLKKQSNLEKGKNKK